MAKLNTLLGLRNPVVLASASPRRKQLLENIGLQFSVFHTSVDEAPPAPGQSPSDYVMELAVQKCKAALPHIVQDSVVIAADTVVYYNEKILGKPESQHDAKDMLEMLSGDMHEVFTGYCICNMANERNHTGFSRTEVHFRKLSAEEIYGYVSTGSPMDKAGSYGIQEDMGSVFVSHIVGDYFNVVGLPINKVYQALRQVSVGNSL
jgi:septum formation protein